MESLFFGRSEMPLSCAEEVDELLAEPGKQWRPAYSAYETAHSWFDANGFPLAIQEILRTDAIFSTAKLKKAYFERQTQLDDSGRRPSQTDVLAFVELDSGLGVLGVEGKVNESFGPRVAAWLDYSPGKLRRLAGLIDRLRLKHSPSLGLLRYQLFHRTVATLLEAERAGAHDAAMVVQSFSPDDTRTGFNDFQEFATTLGTPVADPGQLSAPIELSGVRIRLGWTVNAFRSGGR